MGSAHQRTVKQGLRLLLTAGRCCHVGRQPITETGVRASLGGAVRDVFTQAVCSLKVRLPSSPSACPRLLKPSSCLPGPPCPPSSLPMLSPGGSPAGQWPKLLVIRSSALSPTAHILWSPSLGDCAVGTGKRLQCVCWSVCTLAVCSARATVISFNPCSRPLSNILTPTLHTRRLSLQKSNSVLTVLKLTSGKAGMPA